MCLELIFKRKELPRQKKKRKKKEKKKRDQDFVK
jgi:hypothetical protein